MMIKKKFYTLSFTWGIIMTTIGLLVAIVLRCVGKKPKKWGLCYHFEIGENWGGVTFGFVIITSKNPSSDLKNHEHGHALQNCIIGPLMPFIVCIPSAVRYWYREYVWKHEPDKYRTLPDYDAIWFEGQATKWGTAFMKESDNGRI